VGWSDARHPSTGLLLPGDWEKVTSVVQPWLSIVATKPSTNCSECHRGRKWSCDNRFCVAALFMWFCADTYFFPFISWSIVSPSSFLPPSPLSPPPCVLFLLPAYNSGDLRHSIPPLPIQQPPELIMSAKVAHQSEGRVSTRSVLFLSLLRSPMCTICPSPSVDQPITSSTWIRIHPLRISRYIPSLNSQPLTLFYSILGPSL